MSDQHSSDAFNEDGEMDFSVHDGERRRSPAMEWARTLILCGLLLGGLLVVLPLMPDKDPRGVDTQATSTETPERLSSLQESDLTAHSVISQPVSVVRHSGDGRHRT